MNDGGVQGLDDILMGVVKIRREAEWLKAYICVVMGDKLGFVYRDWVLANSVVSEAGFRAKQMSLGFMY